MLDRYARHALIDWFPLDRIRALKAAVVGAGAVGNEVIKNLALLGVGEIHIFDFDKIELHNLTRSVLFREGDIGKSKSEVAASRAQKLDPNVKCFPHHADFWDVVTISSISEFDVVFCCVDNFEARIKLNTLCYIAEKDFINVGIDSRFCSVEIFPFSISQKRGCYECLLPDSVYRRMSARYSCGHLRKAAFVERKVPTTAVTASMASGFAVSAGLRLAAAEGADDSPRKLLMDTITGRSTLSEAARKADCPCCGRIGSQYRLLKCERSIGKLTGEIPAGTITFSDPILVGYSIPGEGVCRIVFDVASKFDDSYALTLSDDPGNVALEIRDEFEIAELASRFSGMRLPVKFGIARLGSETVIIEFGRAKDE